MLVPIFICEVITTTYSFVLQDTFNLLIKDSSDYKVDMVINEEDYEMIGGKQLVKFKIDDKLFSELNKMASIENAKTSSLITENDMSLPSSRPETTTLPVYVISTLNVVTTTYIGHLTTHANKKRELVNENEMEYEYNYNDLIHEYYEQSDNGTEALSSEIQDYGVVSSFKRLFILQKDNNNCNKSIGLQAIQSLLEDYKNHRRPTKEVVSRLWRIAQIWFLVYLLVAVPLWCTRGWCCCCLCCKFFKPRQTIEEAKRYLVLNPPGVYKTKSGEVRYDPTDRERETYEEFEHFIKTL